MGEITDMLIAIAATATLFLLGLWLFNWPAPAGWGSIDIFPPKLIGICIMGLGVIGEVMLASMGYQNVSSRK